SFAMGSFLLHQQGLEFLTVLAPDAHPFFGSEKTLLDVIEINHPDPTCRRIILNFREPPLNSYALHPAPLAESSH
uniref:hypothetical protein n=1 Tax=Klebsiella pneumoniae TaxID=573 RepID=UPI00259FE330